MQVLVVVGVLLLVGSWLLSDGLPFLIVILILAVAWKLLSLQTAERRRRQRLQELTERFDEDIANRIMNKEVWQGQTEEMLIESKGSPVDVIETVSLRHKKQTFKYDEVGCGRFRTKVHLRDGIVVGWEG